MIACLEQLLVPPEEQEGFTSLPTTLGRACHPCPADFWGLHLERRVWRRCTWCTASLLQAGSDSQGINSRGSELVQLSKWTREGVPAPNQEPLFLFWLLVSAFLAQSPSGSGRDLGTGVETAGGGLGKGLGSG